VASDGGTPAQSDWAQACLHILEAGAAGTDRVFALLVAAARRLCDGDGASVVA